ncbi:hypothetical protein BpHYR1_034820 [Brachionus plicatilis]|uniref:Uncharacterized protein n=1 Tax=Brachionus plicatilis TaxID=10195 RepID=A0A3M7S914_BRAPC|nr:hypothetical protein BpHYR1_034820 [Brachionus plicatilis]
MTQMINRLRRQASRLGSDQTVSHRGEEADRIIILGTQDNPELLKRESIWYVDGTFDVSPKLFKIINSIKLNFPKTTVCGCFFHFNITDSICSSSQKETTFVKDKEGRILTTEKEHGQLRFEHFREVLNRPEPLEFLRPEADCTNLDINTEVPSLKEKKLQ